MGATSPYAMVPQTNAVTSRINAHLSKEVYINENMSGVVYLEILYVVCLHITQYVRHVYFCEETKNSFISSLNSDKVFSKINTFSFSVFVLFMAL